MCEILRHVMINRLFLACTCFLISTAVLAVGTPEDCAWEVTQATVTTTEPDGTQTTWIHLFYTYSCSVTVEGGSSGGGGTPPPPPPLPSDPYLRMRSISDADPTAPVLNIETFGISSIDLYINGNYVRSYGGATASIILPSLHTFTDYSTPIALEGHSDQGPADVVAEVTRAADVRRGSSVLIIHWYMESEGLTPIEEELSYYRTVDDLITYTSYSIPTEGARNGRVEQELAQDTIHRTEDYGAFGFTSTFRISSLLARNLWNEGICWVNFNDGHQWHSSHCTDDMGEFVYENSTATSVLSGPGRVDMVGFRIIQGDEITITP